MRYWFKCIVERGGCEEYPACQHGKCTETDPAPRFYEVGADDEIDAYTRLCELVEEDGFRAFTITREGYGYMPEYYHLVGMGHPVFPQLQREAQP